VNRAGDIVKRLGEVRAGWRGWELFRDVALIAEAEAGARARLELIEKLGEQQDEALRELERLSRPWWKRRGKK